MSGVRWPSAADAGQYRAVDLPGLPRPAGACIYEWAVVRVEEAVTWGGDHPDGPEPSHAETIAGLILLGVVIGAAAVVWIISVVWILLHG